MTRTHAITIAAAALAASLSGAEPTAEAKCGGNAIRLYSDPLSYEVLRDGKVLVPATEIGVCLDGKCLAKGAAVREVSVVAAAEGKVATPIYKKSEVDLRRQEKFVDFGDFAVRIVARGDGVAYRFELKRAGVVTCEKADLTLPTSARCQFNRTPRTALGCEETVPEFADAAKLRTDGEKAFYLPFG